MTAERSFNDKQRRMPQVGSTGARQTAGFVGVQGQPGLFGAVCRGASDAELPAAGDVITVALG